jgi:hypothetical protein
MQLVRRKIVSPVYVIRACKISAFVITGDETEVVTSSCDAAFCLRPMTGTKANKSARFALGNPRSIR